MSIIADLHTHTLSASHAFHTVTEMAAAAAALGYRALAVTDHAPAMPDAPHIWHFQNRSPFCILFCFTFLRLYIGGTHIIDIICKHLLVFIRIDTYNAVAAYGGVVPSALEWYLGLVHFSAKADKRLSRN